MNQLLNSARKIGLLEEAAESSGETNEFTFVENKQGIKQFLEDES